MKFATAPEGRGTREPERENRECLQAAWKGLPEVRKGHLSKELHFLPPYGAFPENEL